jgi:hypothetical protein
MRSLKTSSLALLAAASLGVGAASAQVGQVKDEDALRAVERAVDANSLWAAAVVGGAVRLDLFDDLAFVLDVERRWETRSGFSISGHVRGEADAPFSIAVEQGQVSATIKTHAGDFGLVPTGRADALGNGLCEARQLKPGAALKCAMGAGVRPVSRTDVRGMQAIGQGSMATPPPQTQAAGGGGGPSPTGACDCADDQSAVDILFVYTSAALSASGGLPALTAKIQNAIADCNQSYIDSAITAGGPVNRLTIRLAGVQPIAYDEVSPQWLDHLDRLTNPTDGFMDGVHAQRNTYHADLVSLAVDDTRFTGGAAFYAVYSDTSAFSVLNWRALGSGSFTLAHELGHNFGCAHDRGNSTFSPFRYAWGYSFAGNGTTYGTIMSYTGATFVPKFSNPFVIHAPTGQPLGTPLANPLATDNALAIATTHWTIASYRDAPGMKDCNGNGIDDATDIANGTSQDANGNCRPDECEQRLYVDAGNTGVVDGLSWNTAWTSLADALAFASMKCSNVSEIWVADGTYKPDTGGSTDSAGSRYASFHMRTGLAVIGGFQGKSRPGGGETSIGQRVLGGFPSILSGDVGTPGVDTDNSYNVVFAQDTDSSAVLDGFTIERGYQDGDGAGMYATDSSVTVRNCTFRNNRAGGSAGFNATGAISAPTLTNCAFFSNTSVYTAAGAGARGGARVTVDGCTVHDCTATYGGALGVYDNSTLTVRGSLLENNTASSNSGAIDCYNGAALTVQDTTIRNNHALASGAGAAVVHTGCTGAFTNCSMTGNTCVGAGGAVWVESSQATFTGCTIENNTAGDGGGGLAAYGNSTLTVDTSTIRGNHARWGGGLTSDSSSLVVRRSTLETNQATQYSGGGIDLYNNNSLSMVSSVVRANTAADGGAGISLAFGNPLTVSNCTVYGNSAVNSGGGIGIYQATLNINNSILYANTTGGGQSLLDQQLTVFSGGVRTFNYSCVQGGGGSPGSPGQLGGAGNIGISPVLMNPGAGDVTLAPVSPCIDAGSNALAIVSVPLDRAGNPRFVDAPAVSDTGVGPAPVVDMGAYEFIPPPSCPADIGTQGGLPGHDGHLDNNDFVVFIDYFFNHNPLADRGIQGGIPGHDNQWDNNDFVVFIDQFFAGC